MFHHDMLSFDTVKMNKCDNLSDILIQTSVYRKNVMINKAMLVSYSETFPPEDWQYSVTFPTKKSL